MNTTELRKALRDELLTICDTVHDTFVYPDEYADIQGAFPYITMVFGLMPLENGTKRGKREISIIGIVKGNQEELMEKRDKLESDIILQLYHNSKIACTILDIDSQNIFKPYGLESGIFPPYAGTLIRIEVPQAIEAIS